MIPQCSSQNSHTFVLWSEAKGVGYLPIATQAALAASGSAKLLSPTAGKLFKVTECGPWNFS